jgi:4-hydroxy-3-polyprenylbenzoate decarboxylase
MEDCYLAKATERMFLPLLQLVMPEIRDYWFPWEGVFHNIVIVSIEKEYAGHAQKLMSGLWGQGQMSFCKAIVVVDASIDPGNPDMVARELLTRIDLTSDITLTRGVLDVLDHSSPFANFGHKIGIDLTPRTGGEPPRTSRRSRNRTSTGRPEEALARLPGVIRTREVFRGLAGEISGTIRVAVLAYDKDAGGSGARFAPLLLDAAEGLDFDIFVLFDPEIDLSDGSLLLWKIFNNVDPGRDLVFGGGRLVIDACRKGPIDGHPREWPESLSLEEPPAGA